MRVFDIQRASFVDGPGVRTVIFLKGCNLRCKWCHNPESWTEKKQLMAFENRCVGCGKCRTVCPAGAIDERIHTDREKCRSCGACIPACHAGARKLCGQDQTVDALFDIILEDECFYQGTGGGVTFSGGECMLQADELCELAKKCSENGIHTAVDTAGNVSWESFEKILPYTNLFLYDLKLMSAERHVAYTGVDNSLILCNLGKLLARCPEKVRIRIPVLPGINTENGEFEKMRDFLARYPRPDGVDLLPYHRLGENKQVALGYENAFRCRLPTSEEIAHWRLLFEAEKEIP